MKINIGYLLYKRAMLSPKMEALVVEDVRRTYPELNDFGITMIFKRTFEPTEFLNLIKTENISLFGSVPQVLMFLSSVSLFETFDWSSIKLALVYAAPVPVPLIIAFAEKGMEVRQLYGLTEYNNPEDTARTIIDGWLYTGDIAKMDADGFLYILDRKKDMIISGGENIYPAEVEDCLLGHPSIADVGVIGMADETWGEAVKAIVVLEKEENLTKEDLIEWCRGRLAPFKTPKNVILTDQIPRTPTGKILKRLLREKFN